jgi:hypothetical protein
MLSDGVAVCDVYGWVQASTSCWVQGEEITDNSFSLNTYAGL